MTRVTKRKPEPPVTVVAGDRADRKGKLQVIGGSKSDRWNSEIANQVIRALWKHSDPEMRDEQFSGTVAAMVGIGPKDELEGMIAAQLIAAHNAAMECYRRAMLGEQTFEGRRENLAQASKASRTFTALLEALNRHRGKGQQRVTVEHVTVNAGGQAIVGNVESPRPGGGASPRSEDQPHAITHAPGATLQGTIEAEREAVPVAGSSRT
jgi:hypothetical protein